MKKNNLLHTLLSIGLCLFAGGIGSIFTVSAIPTWYQTLNKPFFNPPNWIFAPVWITLYFLMGISLSLVWNSTNKPKVKMKGITYFLIQIGLNSLWSILFFGFHSPILAFLGIILLWIMIYTTIRNFFKISVLAGKLLLPYLAWVGFAAILNLSIVLLNK